MKRQECGFRQTAIAAGLLLAFGPAWAQQADDEVARLIHPDSSVTVGVDNVSGKGRRFGEYTGQNKGGSDAIGAADINRRDDATGTWMRFKARNLGLDNRDLRFENEKQGDWGYFVEYGELKRHDPNSFITPIGGIGSNTLVLNPAGSPTTEYKPVTKRETTKLGFDKTFGEGLSFQLRFRNDDKDGSRNFGFYDVGRTSQFAVEPINQNTREVEATVAYAGEKFQLSGGYLGSFFKNDNKSIKLTGDLGLFTLGAFSANPAPWPYLSLPLDNESHKLHLSGGYDFTAATHGTFKVAYTRGRQNSSFFSPSIFGSSSLDGRVDTTLVSLGLSSRPTSKLTWNANLRYEDRDDKTPHLQYFNVPPNYTGSGFNTLTSRKTVTGKFDATYRLPMGFSLFGGVEWEKRNRQVPDSRSLNWRASTDEASARVGLRRSLADDLTGKVSYVRSERTGSAYQPTSNYTFRDFFTGSPGNSVPRFNNPLHWADRSRDKLKLDLDWNPLAALSLQFAAQYAYDAYKKYDGSSRGNDNGKAVLYSVDAAYSLSENSKLTAWISQDDTRMRQSTNTSYVANVPTVPWSSDLRSLGRAVGLGAQVKVTEKFQVDAELQSSNDRSEFNMNGPGVTSLPNITYRHNTFKLTGDYAIRSNMGLKLQYIYDKWSSDDWTWSQSIYRDGTTVTADPNQRVNFIGVSAYFKWM